MQVNLGPAPVRKIRHQISVPVFLLVLCIGSRAGTALGQDTEREWHMPGVYANLTIDDPWLTEPYGFMSYRDLLGSMERSNYHTTIAFIPWNYDRSEETVATLVRDNPARFSISVHGNNHDHQEFYRYETGPSDSWPAKPIGVQEKNIVQALARMERFKELTGIEYDKVLIFPHSIAPAKTLGLLKKYGFLSTVNAGNVPLGTEPPTESPKRYFEPLLFENFVSLDRWGASLSEDKIIDALAAGRPLLFHEHHAYFESSIDAFSSVAESVNALEPSVQWKSLGYISRHLYLLRLRPDGDYDVRAFSGKTELENKHSKSIIYHVEKTENFIPPVLDVQVDGEPITFEQTDDVIRFAVEVPAGASSIASVVYETAVDLSAVDISRKGLRINTLRRLSDFRDLQLANSAVGKGATALYYGLGLYRFGLLGLGLIGAILLFTMTLSALAVRRTVRKKRVTTSA